MVSLVVCYANRTVINFLLHSFKHFDINSEFGLIRLSISDYFRSHSIGCHEDRGKQTNSIRFASIWPDYWRWLLLWGSRFYYKRGIFCEFFGNLNFLGSFAFELIFKSNIVLFLIESFTWKIFLVEKYYKRTKGF